jgi:hypothetical protein
VSCEEEKGVQISNDQKVMRKKDYKLEENGKIIKV